MYFKLLRNSFRVLDEVAIVFDLTRKVGKLLAILRPRWDRVCGSLGPFLAPVRILPYWLRRCLEPGTRHLRDRDIGFTLYSHFTLHAYHSYCYCIIRAMISKTSEIRLQWVHPKYILVRAGLMVTFCLLERMFS